MRRRQLEYHNYIIQGWNFSSFSRGDDPCLKFGLSVATAWLHSNDQSWMEIKKLKGHLDYTRQKQWNKKKCKLITETHDSKNARSALSECYVHVTQYSRRPRKCGCMISLDWEWYVHVKIVITIPRKMLLRKLHGQNGKRFFHWQSHGRERLWCSRLQIENTLSWKVGWPFFRFTWRNPF